MSPPGTGPGGLHLAALYEPRVVKLNYGTVRRALIELETEQGVGVLVWEDHPD